MAEVPAGDFICQKCRAAGVTSQQMAAGRQQYAAQQQEAKQPVLFPLADQRRRDEKAAALHGRLVVKDGSMWGRVQYKGALSRPKYVDITYGDGSVEKGLTCYRVTQGTKHKLQPEGVTPPAGVRVPEA
jgi:hypothetical protein